MAEQIATGIDESVSRLPLPKDRRRVRAVSRACSLSGPPLCPWYHHKMAACHRHHQQTMHAGLAADRPAASSQVLDPRLLPDRSLGIPPRVEAESALHLKCPPTLPQCPCRWAELLKAAQLPAKKQLPAHGCAARSSDSPLRYPLLESARRSSLRSHSLYNLRPTRLLRPCDVSCLQSE